jgi:hypothetical protein
MAKGRPRKDINVELVRDLLEVGATALEISVRLGMAFSTADNKLRDMLEVGEVRRLPGCRPARYALP